MKEENPMTSNSELFFSGIVQPLNCYWLTNQQPESHNSQRLIRTNLGFRKQVKNNLFFFFFWVKDSHHNNRHIKAASIIFNLRWVVPYCLSWNQYQASSIKIILGALGKKTKVPSLDDDILHHNLWIWNSGN